MGCGASSERIAFTPADPVPAKAEASKAAAANTATAEAVAQTAKVEEKGTAKKKAASSVPAALVAFAAATAPNFPMTTPMLVSPWRAFKAQGRIFKSVKAWREAARADGRLVEYVPSADAPGKKRLRVIFISHTWWDRTFKDETSDPQDKYDKGAPDKQSGPDKDLKYKIICKGVENLMKEKGLNEDEVALWIDWQSIYQDDKEEKLKGVESLIKYTTLCEFMLVPTEEEMLPGSVAQYPERIPGYGKRGWCRCEEERRRGA